MSQRAQLPDSTKKKSVNCMADFFLFYLWAALLLEHQLTDVEDGLSSFYYFTVTFTLV